jgi:hypothetical protein
MLLMLSLSSSTALADKSDCSDDPRKCFNGFDPNGKVITRDKEAERTFNFPPVKAGFIVDLHIKDILPTISAEALEIDAPWNGDFSVDVGVATSRVFTSLTWEFLPIVKAGPSIWVGYNVRETDVAYGVGFTMLDF